MSPVIALASRHRVFTLQRDDRRDSYFAAPRRLSTRERQIFKLFRANPCILPLRPARGGIDYPLFSLCFLRVLAYQRQHRLDLLRHIYQVEILPDLTKITPAGLFV